jgi:hypothetical protein
MTSEQKLAKIAMIVWDIADEPYDGRAQLAEQIRLILDKDE